MTVGRNDDLVERTFGFGPGGQGSIPGLCVPLRFLARWIRLEVLNKEYQFYEANYEPSSKRAIRPSR